jgi:hypothetical protein
MELWVVWVEMALEQNDAINREVSRRNEANVVLGVLGKIWGRGFAELGEGGTKPMEVCGVQVN